MAHADAARIGSDRALAVACLIVLSFTLFAAIPKAIDGSGATGLDFSCFWTAGAMALDGHAAAAYDWHQLRELILRIHPSLNQAPYPVDENPTPFFYPPVFFFVAALLAQLPFPIAFWTWSAAKLLCWAVVVCAIRPGAVALLLAFATPPVLYDFLVGQSSLLAASLLCGILLTLDRHPIVSGVLIALLTFKPQYGVLLPLVLIVTGRWTVVITASLVIPVFILLTGLIFGWDTFVGFREAATFATQFHLTGGLAWYKLQSVYGVLRFAGFGYGLAMTLHIAVAGAVTIWVLIIWHRNVSFAVKAASLLTATLLVSPYFAIYDAAILAGALVFLMNASMAERSLLLSNRSALRIGFGVLVLLGFAYPIVLVPLGPFMCATVIAMIWIRCRQPGVKSDLAYG
ncbi:glycosyltransferase family 87 protein [Bradyrhizobium sp. B120]|uniref:glycosyltransferase family 87 protein n=1 Tax=Bradyrhizobium sp. B120 TaxID=3410088 RepID=UPI003B98134C